MGKKIGKIRKRVRNLLRFVFMCRPAAQHTVADYELDLWQKIRSPADAAKLDVSGSAEGFKTSSHPFRPGSPVSIFLPIRELPVRAHLFSEGNRTHVLISGG